MRYGHINLLVRHMDRAENFYRRYFEFTSAGHHDGMVVMQDRDGFDLVLEEGIPGPDGFHFGFRVDDPDELDRMRDAFTADGIELIDEMDEFMTSFKVHDPDGYAVEVYCY